MITFAGSWIVICGDGDYAYGIWDDRNAAKEWIKTHCEEGPRPSPQFDGLCSSGYDVASHRVTEIELLRPGIRRT